MKDNGHINTVEKKYLADLIKQEYGDIIDTMQQEIRFTEGEILEEAKNKFGIKLIDQEINNLEEKIKLLQNKKKELGFDNSYNSNGFSTKFMNGQYVVDSSTKAGRFYYLKMAHQADIQKLKQQRDQRLKDLWLTNDRQSISKLAQQKIDVPMIEFKRKEGKGAQYGNLNRNNRKEQENTYSCTAHDMERQHLCRC